MTARPVLTPQRREALELLREYHYLATPDFYRLLGVAETDEHRRRGVRRMLMLLARAGLVEHARHVVDNPGDPFLRYQHCYRLSRTGAVAVSARRAMGAKAPASVAHELEITAFHVALASAIPETHSLYWRQWDLKHTVNPDALFAITDSREPRERSTHYYFLEVEKSRQGHYRNGDSGLIAKLRRYAEYRRTERCRSEWRHFSDFRAIVVLKNRERELNLLRALHERLPERFIWTTTEEDYRRDIGGAIFRAPPDHGTTAHSLFT
jgi:hypothetical protein